MQKLAPMTECSPYQLKPDRFSSHFQIAKQLQRSASMHYSHHPYTVLDVGCASGFLRTFLPSPEFRLIGIEGDPVLAKEAQRKYDDIYQADLNLDLDLSLTHAPDAIVLADVLEHLPYPNKVLVNLLQRYAKPGTQVIISLPNIAHLYVRLSLLLGKFEYSDRGILDRTHLRFYTLQSAQRLCVDCQIHLNSLKVTPVPLPLVHPWFREGQILFPLHAFSATLASVFKGLLAFQFILSGVYDR